VPAPRTLAAASARGLVAVLYALIPAATVSLTPAAAEPFARLSIPRSAHELVVVSSPTTEPPGPQAIATLCAYARSRRRGARWHLVMGPWPAETGAGHLIAATRRLEGDRATPLGVFRFGATIYGNRPDPGGLHYRYHRLVCGDWWDEDRYSPRYNRFVHVRCGVRPIFAATSEALWTETLAYPYFAVIDFNIAPIRGGAAAPGSGIFLHSWIGGATQGCVALPEPRLLRVLRWLRPSRSPVIEVGTDAQLASLR
jgi:L,D-peptidoglycan transpeptidase YkuD (ErfK/YbiS/YcfS/YnhG family)